MKITGTIQKLNRARIKFLCKLHQVQAQDILEGHEDLDVRIPLVATHWETASLFDHLFIASLVRAIKPQVCFEIGTSLGLVTATIAANSSARTQIHTLDLSNDARIGSFFHNRPEQLNIRQHFGPSSSFDFSELKGKVDLMFIDGSHEYGDVVRDSENAFRVISDRGVIVWHDVSPYFPGVIRALESLPNASQICQVFGTSCGAYVSPGAPLTRTCSSDAGQQTTTDDAHSLLHTRRVRRSA